MAVSIGQLDAGTWSAMFGMSLLELLIKDSHSTQHVIPDGHHLRVKCASGGIADGRNELATRFLSTDSDWLLMIDSDMGFGVDAVDRLLAAADPAERPVMGGLCFKQVRTGFDECRGEQFKMSPTLFDFVEGDDVAGFLPRYDYEADSVERVDATGAAFLLTHRDVFAKVKASEGDTWFDEIRADGNRYSEDLSFMMRVGAEGIPVHVHTGVRTVHDKGGVFLSEPAYIAQQEAA